MMDQQVLSLLRGSLSATASHRQSAELQMGQLEFNEAYPLSLVNVASHMDLPEVDRQTALLALNRYCQRRWSSLQEDYEDDSPNLSDEIRNAVRQKVLEIVFSIGVTTKIMNATANVIATIAKSDFPEDWPDLIEGLLTHLSPANDEQADVICTVFKELLRESLDETQFYRYAGPLIGALREIAENERRKQPVRASAVSVFIECFSFVQNLKEQHSEEMAHFAQNVCAAWQPFLTQITKDKMPDFPNEDQDGKEDDAVNLNWRGMVALKRSVVMVLMKIQDVFPEIMPAQELFEAVWAAVQSHARPYYDSFIIGERQGNMVSATGVAYTIDLLVIEEIDYMEMLIDAPEVKQRLEDMQKGDGSALASWLESVFKILIMFSSIPREAEDMWTMDYNIFLTEETFAESSSTPRSMCASFAWKLSNRFGEHTVHCLRNSYAGILSDAGAPWREKEAVLYNLQQVAEEYDNDSKILDMGVVNDLIRTVQPLLDDQEDLLRARAHTVMAAIVGAWYKRDDADHVLAAAMAQRCVNAIANDGNDVVKVACIRVIPDYLGVLTGDQSTVLQPGIVAAVNTFIRSQDLGDHDAVSELVDAVLQTLRDTIMANPTTCLDIHALDVILELVKHGAARESHSSILIDEAFTSAAESMAELGPQAYGPFCQRVLPSLLAGLDIQEADKATEENLLVDVSVSLIRILAESARAPLPDGFVNMVMPRLHRLIYGDIDFYLMQSATLAIKAIVDNDSTTVFNWVDPNYHKNGLEVCFLVIGHLLGPNMSDASAAEVGELANTVVEKAGEGTIGASMYELIAVLANRLHRAEHPQLIQSLVMVFARLALKYASDLITFLHDTAIEGDTDKALTLVLRKWLENSVNFAGFDTIRQNMQALVTIYSLHDPRVDNVTVQGDMIPDTSSRIRTRSQAKTRPIQFTAIPAPLKIVKLIVGELVPYNDPTGPLKSPAVLAAPMARRGSGDDEWESDDDDDDDTPFAQRVADDSTQRYLIEFLQSQGMDPRFRELYSALTDDEKIRGQRAVEQYHAMQAQSIQLGAVPRT